MKLPVYIETTATAFIGYVEADSEKEFKKAAEALWEEKETGFDASCERFDLGEWEIDYSHINYYLKRGKIKNV